MNAREIAELCHEVNRAYCLGIGDSSQPTWADAPDWQKESAINGVMFHLENETTPKQSHENWMKEKEADGWIYGEVKDPEKKEHPCMVPYYELPLEQRTKDYLFKAVVDTMKNSILAKTPAHDDYEPVGHLVACEPVEDPGANLWKLLNVIESLTSQSDLVLKSVLLNKVTDYVEESDLGAYELSEIMRRLSNDDLVARSIIRKKMAEHFGVEL